MLFRSKGRSAKLSWRWGRHRHRLRSSVGSIDVELQLDRSPLSAVPVPDIETAAKWDPLRTPSGPGKVEFDVQNELRRLMDEARFSLRQRNFRNAIHVLDRCLKWLAESIDCSHLLGYANDLSGNERGAVASDQKWLSLAPRDQRRDSD